MSTAHNVPSYPHWAAQAVSSTTTYYSGAPNPKEGGGNALGSDVRNTTHVTFVGQLTGTPNGTLTVQISDASDDDILRGVDVWDTYTAVNGDGFSNGVATVTAGQINSKAIFSIELKKFGFRRVRLQYVNSSGSGTITVTVTVKGS